MKKITIKKIKEVLQDLNADDSTTELVMNNVLLYNDLVDQYNSGTKTNNYLLYQLNNQIIKQIEGIKKLNIKLDQADVTEDDFTTMINTIKKATSPQTPLGFIQNKKKDIETRG